MNGNLGNKDLGDAHLPREFMTTIAVLIMKCYFDALRFLGMINNGIFSLTRVAFRKAPCLVSAVVKDMFTSVDLNATP